MIYHKFLKQTAAPSIADAGAVLLAAEFAVGGRLRIVNAMLDGLERAQVGEDGFEIVIAHVLGDHRWHGRTQVAGPYEAGAHNRGKKGVVPVRNARAMR